MLTVDFHTHSIASIHALSTIAELLHQADKNKMDGIAITDHSPGIDNTAWLIKNQPLNTLWQNQIKGPDLAYFKTLLSRYQQPSDVKAQLFKGIECNILSQSDRLTDVPIFMADHFDIVIASLHPLPLLFKVENRNQITERVIAAMDDPIDIIGHPYQHGCCPIMEPLVTAAVEKEIALELNNLSFQLGKANTEQAVLMLKLAKQKGCCVAVSSDAHMSTELGGDTKIKQLLSEAKFPEQLIINRTIQATRAFVKTRKKIRVEKKKTFPE